MKAEAWMPDPVKREIEELVKKYPAPCARGCPECFLKNGMERQLAGTPQALFDALNDEYGFTIDVCACPFNAKLPRFVSAAEDALACSWSGERAWCNPPYVNIPAWLDHAEEPELAAYLLPARTDRDWWRRWKPLAETHYLVGQAPEARVQFEPPPGVKYTSNADCNVLLIFGKGATPGLEAWRSGKDGRRL